MARVQQVGAGEVTEYRFDLVRDKGRSYWLLKGYSFWYF